MIPNAQTNGKTSAPFPVENVPDELKKINRWLPWKQGASRADKIPLHLHTGRACDPHDASNWFPFDDVLGAVHSRGFTGPAFELSQADDIVGLDLDDVIDAQGRLAPDAEAVIRELDTYTEVSPSGTGVKLWFRCTNRELSITETRPGVEFYGYSRFFCVTGRRWGERSDVPDRTEVWRSLRPRLFPPKEKRKGDWKQKATNTSGPVDSFNAVATVESLTKLLTDHGGTVVRENTILEGAYIRRPSQGPNDEPSSKGVHVYQGEGGVVLAYFYTTNWPPFEQRQAYTPAAVYAGLKYGGITGSAFAKAAKDFANSAKVTAPKYVRPYVPFPVKLLPEPLCSYVQAAADAIPCDTGYIAPHVLAACAGCIGLSRVIRLKGGKRRNWSEPPIIWSAVVAYSGTCKSPAFDVAIDDVQSIETELNEEHALAEEQYRRELKAYKADGGEGEEPKPPIERRIRIQDTTIEAMAITLINNRKLVLARDELRAWVEGFRAYKGKSGGNDMPKWLEIHRGNPISVDRKTGDHKKVRVSRAAVSVCGTIQPKIVAKAFDSEAFDAGCVARILLTMPPRQPKVWSDTEVAEVIAEQYHSLVRKLYALEPDTSGDRPYPHALRLSPEALSRWKRFVNQWGAKTFASAEQDASAFSKLEGYAARFALIFHIIRHIHDDKSDLVPVELNDLERGIALAHWFADEAERVYATLRDPDNHLRELAEWVARRKDRCCTPRELHRCRPRVYSRSEHAEHALQELVDAGYGLWDEKSPGTQGRPSRTFRLHPPGEESADETDETSPEDDDGRQPSADETHDETTKGADETHTTPDESGDSSVLSAHQFTGNRRKGESEMTGTESGTREVSSAQAESFVSAAYSLITDPANLPAIAGAIEESTYVAIDLETTGLNALVDRIRLLSLSVDTVDGGRFSYLVDCFAVDPSPLFPAMASAVLIGHNLAFDLAFLSRRGFQPGQVRDTMLLSQVLYASAYIKGTGFTRHALKDCCQRELGIELRKELQASDWSGHLSTDQLKYAATDVHVLVRLHDQLAKKLAESGLQPTAVLECSALPCIAWMASKGVPFDRSQWSSLATIAKADVKRIGSELNAIAPARSDELFDSSWNWDSPEQVRQVLALAGHSVESTSGGVLSELDSPIAKLLRDYRDASKRATTYGDEWARKHVAADNRIYANWSQLGANSGRMACGSPNMQNIKRDAAYRKAFAAPPGRILVKADYSQIELRIAAKISGDKALLAAYERGEDLHALTAKNVLGIQEVTKQHRQLAKAINFGLLYGMGAKAFRSYAKANYGVELSETEAQSYRDAFFRSYPGLRRWHRSMGDQPIDIRTLIGRRVSNVQNFTEKLNLPVQGSGADGLKAALALLWQRRGECPDGFPILAVHDEIVIECDADSTTKTTLTTKPVEWLRSAMIDSMTPLIAPVPVEVDVKIVRTWGG